MCGRKGTMPLAIFALAIGFLFGSASVQAKSVCKGLEFGQCQKKGVLQLGNVVQA